MTRLVIGLGSPFRGDDAAGLAVAGRVAGASRRLTGGYELMALWEGADEVVVVDAMRSGAPAGSVRRFDPHREPLPAATFVSSHAVGLAETVELARALGRLPARMVVYGIEAGHLRPGDGLSQEVAAAAVRVAAEIQGA